MNQQTEHPAATPDCEICGKSWLESRITADGDRKTIWKCGRELNGSHLEVPCPYSELKLFSIRQSLYALKKYVKACEIWMHDAKICIQETGVPNELLDSSPSQLLENAEVVFGYSIIISIIELVLTKANREGNLDDFNMGMFVETLFRTYELVANSKFSEAEQLSAKYMKQLGVAQSD